jgi:hypothetical protein
VVGMDLMVGLNASLGYPLDQSHRGLSVDFDPRRIHYGANPLLANPVALHALTNYWCLLHLSLHPAPQKPRGGALPITPIVSHNGRLRSREIDMKMKINLVGSSDPS